MTKQPITTNQCSTSDEDEDLDTIVREYNHIYFHSDVNNKVFLNYVVLYGKRMNIVCSYL